MKSKESGLIFNLKDIAKRTFGDRWVKFAFGPQGKIETRNLNLGVVNFDADKEAFNHRHDVAEALFVLSGNGKIKIGSKVYNIKRNDFIHVPSGTDHLVMTEKSKVKILFIFGGNILIDK
ncbi:MAG: cupin domain-containing protein [Actinobacteria bacterium]|nr:cupin domain-containing protein [Actinomycetota bacterium]MCL5073247.1 cupin domain-containing protein [Actinomycetota bacterium]